VLAGELLVQCRHLVDNRKARAYRALSVVLMRLEPTEVNHQPVAEILGDVTAKTGDRCCRGYLILGGDIAPFFRIEASCDLGRIDQLREQNRQMTALTVRLLALGWRFCRSRRGSSL